MRWEGATFEVVTPLVGRHNLDNLMAATTCALLAGLKPQVIAEAAGSFLGVRRRLEVVGEAGGVTVVDDFAHHPTAVALTLDGARQRFPGRRLVVAFEPRSLTAGRNIFAAAYADALAHADLALLAPVFHRARLGADNALDRDAVVAALIRKGAEAAALPEDGDLVGEVAACLRRGDVAVCMSSGDFSGLPRKLVVALEDAG